MNDLSCRHFSGRPRPQAQLPSGTGPLPICESIRGLHTTETCLAMGQEHSPASPHRLSIPSKRCRKEGGESESSGMMEIQAGAIQ